MEALDIKQIFFTNLLLLDFDPVLMEKKHRVTFSKDMFVLPNKKALHEVIYFLFDKLDHKRCVTEFRDCWPLLDKKQEQQFKKCVTSWLSQITQNDSSSHLPRLVPLFTSSSGDKIYQYMFSLSRYVLSTSLVSRLDKKCYRDFVGYPSCAGTNPRVVSKLLALSIANVRSRYLARTKKMVEAHEMWSSTADMFVKSYRESVKSVKDLKTRLAEDCEQSLRLNSSSTEPDVFTERHSTNEICEFEMAERVQQVHGMIEQLENFTEKILEKKEIFDSFLDGDVGKYKLDGSEMGVVVPGQLLQECEEEIVTNRLHNLQTDGKLNLVSLIKLWNIALKKCQHSFREAGNPDMKEASSKVLQMVRLANSFLKDFTALNREMSGELNPDLTKSVEELTVKVREKYLSDKSPESIKVTSLGFGLVSPLKLPKTSSAGAKPCMLADQSGPVRKSLLSKTPRETSPEIEKRIAQQIEDKLNEKKKKKETAAAATSAASLIVHDSDDDDDIRGGCGNDRLEVTGSDFDPSGDLNCTMNKSSLDDSYFQSDVKVKSSTTHLRSSVKPRLAKSFSSVSTSRSLQIPADVQQKLAKNQIPSAKKNPPSSLKKQADHHLDLLAEKIAERFVQSSGDMSYEYLDDIMENPFEQIEQTAFETKKQLFRTPPVDGARTKSNVIQEEVKDHPAGSSHHRHHRRDEDQILEITDGDGADRDAQKNSFSLLTRNLESFSSCEIIFTDEDFKLAPSSDPMELENLETAKHQAMEHKETLPFSSIENNLHFAKEEYETKYSPGDMQLRRMTALQMELLQSETPKLPARSKIKKVEAKNSDISSDDVWNTWDKSNDFLPHSSPINSESRSKETVGQVGCLIDLNLSESLTPSASPRKNLLPSSDSFSVDLLDSSKASTDHHVSESPSRGRRTSSRFPYRPDLIFDEPAFSEPILDLSNAEEDPGEVQKEESSFGLENSLIDLEGFDDSNLLSSSFLYPAANKL